jgi:lactate dehydrogenase-like 2-hydroxyacid dehydrogenase
MLQCHQFVACMVHALPRLEIIAIIRIGIDIVDLERARAHPVRVTSPRRDALRRAVAPCLSGTARSLPQIDPARITG